MRNQSNFFVSLDGVVESPDEWHFPVFDDEMDSGLLSLSYAGATR